MDGQQQSRWRPSRRQLLWTGSIVAAVAVAVLIGYRYGITLWDWIKLLVVPAVIAGGGIWFNTQQIEREQHIANDRAQDEALQAYLDQMNSLLLEHNLRTSGANSDPRTLARARTLTVLASMAPSRKTRIMQFPVEAALVQGGDEVDPIIRLSGVDLTGADLSHADLSCNFAETPLGTRESCADLSGANLIGTNLIGTNLIGADLSNIDLTHALVTEVQLADTRSLAGGIMPKGQKYEDWLTDREGRKDNTNPS